MKNSLIKERIETISPRGYRILDSANGYKKISHLYSPFPTLSSNCLSLLRMNRKQNTTYSHSKRLKKKTKIWWNNPQILFGLTSTLGIIFITYLPSLSNKFTFWDDNIYVTENPMVYGLAWENIKAIFSQPVAANYHPITMLSFAINYQISGLDAFGYHLINLFLHLSNAVLVFYFVWLLSKGKKWVALIAAVLFGIHPMHVESVAWIAERKDVLYTFFFLLGLIRYLQYRIRKTAKNYLLTFFFFVLSVLSKPSAVVFPLVLILLDYWRYEQKSNSKKHWNWSKILLPKIPFFLVSLLIGTITLQTQSETAIAEIGTFTVLQKFTFVCYGFVMYIIKAFFPFHLAAHHAYPNLEESLAFYYYLMPIGTIIIFIASYYSIKYTKIFFLGMLFFILNIVLVLQFISVGSAILAERYTYVPYIGLFITLGYGFDTLWRTPSNKKILLPLAAIYILGLSYQTFERCKIWKTDETIWTDVLEKYPRSAIAFNNRAAHYSKENQLDNALADFNNALQIYPKYFDSLIGRSTLYQKIGELDKSLVDAQLARAIRPEDERPYICLGGVYFQQKAYDKSLDVSNKALEINPNNAEGRLNRAILYSIKTDFQKALLDFNQFLQFRPNDPRGYLYRGIAYSKVGQLDAAIQDFNQTIQFMPSNGHAYFERSKVHLSKGNSSQALADAQKAESLGISIEAAYFEQF